MIAIAQRMDLPLMDTNAVRLVQTLGDEASGRC